MTLPLRERLMNVHQGEWPRTLLAGGFFFFILFGYFMLRPARESLGVQSGVEIVRYMYVGTLLATAAANPLFSWMVSRLPRRIFVPLTYRFFMLNIVAFVALFLLLKSNAGDPSAARIWVSRVYYVWLTVFALFNTMVFWAVMSDTFTLAQSKRLYPIIAIGGTLGALAGSTYAWSLAELLGTSWLVLTSIVLFECAVQCYRRLSRRAMATARRGDAASTHERAHPAKAPHRCPFCGTDLPGPAEDICPQCGASFRPDTALGGGPLDGLKRTLRSPYLLAIGAYIMALTICSTFLYFTQLRIVSSMTGATDQRTSLFANINLWTQAATLLVQLLVTGQLLRRFGTGRTLMVLPLLTAAGFLALAAAPTYALIVLAQAGYNAGKYAIARPARETLFTVVSPEDRYKSKAFVDTFIYRFGDVVGAAGDSAAEHAAQPAADTAAAKLGATLAMVASVTIPLCALWAGVGWYLGWKQGRLSEGSGPAMPRTSQSGAPTGAALK